ncbi:MAG TPA: TIGR03086 family metal-binding protein, partial [Ilumatobacteraceae bacterium]|nr:TIGR03086 family metal-binding protein [Ilumatobacteraceae bacterium]
SALEATTDLSTPVTLPFGSMPADVALRIAAADLLVHSWDLAKATGQQFDPSAEFIAEVDPFFHQFLQPEVRAMGIFAAEVEVPADASPLDRLVAFAGRQP